ncbi:PC-Esterase domain-containing protein/PMR5N domain-containing protein [Cephalotus follicularis]|uniref:PC-Esterase domain-containing protein/PMR5N domain-containing protein n=1 Tax=Cephalotus follicularis TaxID=3775 RepID=A0A1Q3AW06_CEPFO|nr:PC-Esterase domain-containing protein/PMR5N domain-containing protein [Cephalotus follicularis]
MANSSTLKNRYSFTTLFFIFLFLLSIFLFNKRHLEPSLSLYRNFFPHSNTNMSLLESTSPDAVTGADPPDSSTHLPIPPNSEMEPKEGNIATNSTIHALSVENERNPTTANESGGNSSTERTEKCDFFKGSWLRDEDYPIYKPGSCPYVDEAFDCQTNGRPDFDYLKWRWKPDGCDLPMFNASDFLERLRGKRLMLIGDSMNRNQFESILCLLREGLPDKSKMYEIHGHRITKGRGYFAFKFEDYGCTVEFVRSHFLVKEGVRIDGQGNSNPTLSIDQIDKTAKRWKRADILVFNTGHWWTHGKTSRGKNYYKEGGFLYPKFDAVEAYQRALMTWAKWIDQNVDPAKQLVFYRGYSSAHFRGGDWDSGGTCNGETDPILSGAFINTYPLKMKIVDKVIQQMTTPVILLNVTRLTSFRKDGHPSVYGKNVANGRTVSLRRQDCSHWCLPGIPDAWNELIYATLVFQQTTSKSQRY